MIITKLGSGKQYANVKLQKSVLIFSVDNKILTKIDLKKLQQIERVTVKVAVDYEPKFLGFVTIPPKEFVQVFIGENPIYSELSIRPNKVKVELLPLK